MNTEPSQTAKPRFFDVCIIYVPDYTVLEDIAKSSGVDMSIMGKMFAHEAIHRVYAEKILLALSQYVKQTYKVDQTYTLENTRVALFPTIAELVTTHNLDISTLAKYEVIDKLLADEPIPEQEARRILETISRETGQAYTLENVDVRTEGGSQHG